ncbi:SEL1-like repeat protein [Selenomonas caprae]|uniref:SEL1-like repeat protein n=1 Tax=Selenomonas caprae TaxID=2606905 RepID=A0A5D6WSU7_9FIRM|nr:SEL1-like repeat protein [Selenomonas caprae]TYZ29404.1 SEL1-like repeat protein [Selenomonas caprae]
MHRYQKILALTLVGTGAFMLPDTLPIQAATVQADSVQADAAVHSLQKVTAITSGEQVAVAILEYPKALLPSAVKPTDFAVSGQEITAVMVNDKAELTDKAQAGRYVILQFVKQNNVYDGNLSKKPGRQAKPADDKNGQGTDAPRQSNRKLPNLSLQVVARNKTFWDSHANMTESNATVKDMTAANAPINYSVFAGGNHMYTWSFAYDIEAIRDWLFQQRKDGQPHSLLAKALQDAGLAAERGGIIAAPAMAALGHLYENGLGVEKNLQKAQEWYTKAAISE